MVRRASATHTNSHHTLLTDAWTCDVQILQRGIDAFDVPASRPYHVAFFEIDGDSQLHVNVTHPQEMRGPKGWLGPGVTSAGFTHSRRFAPTPAARILRSIRQMVAAARV